MTKKSNHPPADPKPETALSELEAQPEGEATAKIAEHSRRPTGPLGAKGAPGPDAPAQEPSPEPAAEAQKVPAGEPVSPLVAAADAHPIAEGVPDPLAQSKISGAAGAVDRGNLLSALGRLPLVNSLTGLRSNAQSGYWGTVPASELVAALRAVKLEDEDAQRTLDGIIARAEQGEFSGRR